MKNKRVNTTIIYDIQNQILLIRSDVPISIRPDTAYFSVHSCTVIVWWRTKVETGSFEIISIFLLIKVLRFLARLSELYKSQPLMLKI